jgi:hypothetical protein
MYEVKGEQRKLHSEESLLIGKNRMKYSIMHSEEFHNLYSPKSITGKSTSRRMRCASHVACSQREILLGRLRYKWVDDVKIYFGELRWGGVEWICLVQDRDRQRTLVNVVMRL